ncbi:homeobox-leucine zipper protein HOX19-like isoform X2 [Curcuma longa]|uniref:homeobox-leucine zipper protein HOX19-like isoform X2 n=1 Tax=Curcuma longa TaxID=136217 RepID=UPI003D9EE5E5
MLIHRYIRSKSMMEDACETHLSLALATPSRPSAHCHRRLQPRASPKSSPLKLSTGAAAMTMQQETQPVICDEEEEDSDARKKIRLTREQSAMLEIRFRLQSNLTPKQKQALAKQLNLQPRQVEVWFQNRRARKKLKQTEMDCEFLKRCYEVLSKENQMLKKELQEMKALKLAPRPAIPSQLPAAGLSICPTCGKIGGGDDAAALATPKTGQFRNPFSHSAAC